MRPGDVLEDAFECAEAWHWRATTGNELTTQTRAIVRDAAKAAERLGWLSRVTRDDFTFRGRAYYLLDDDALHEAHSIAEERHVALAWLTSDVPWDAVEIDT